MQQIEYFKVYGERNSGTNFAADLIEKNTGLRPLQELAKSRNLSRPCFHPVLGWRWVAGGWKHGFPKSFKFWENFCEETGEPHVLDKLLIVFIVRDKVDWIHSMMNNPYGFYPPSSVEQVFKKECVINRCIPDFHPLRKDKSEKGTLVEVRYKKIRQYLQAYSQTPNMVFLKLEHLQNNRMEFLNLLRDQFGVSLNESLNMIDLHTKLDRPRESQAWACTNCRKIKNPGSQITCDSCGARRRIRHQSSHGQHKLLGSSRAYQRTISPETIKKYIDDVPMHNDIEQQLKSITLIARRDNKDCI